MQFQIECNSTLLKQSYCYTCRQTFEGTEAKVMICDDQGNSYGEICPTCLKKGFDWLNDRVEKLNQPRKTVALRPSRNLKTPIGA